VAHLYEECGVNSAFSQCVDELSQSKAYTNATPATWILLRAKYVVRHLRPDHAKVDAGYCAHPGLAEKNELQEVKGQFAFNAAGE
jgi:hypothetical protein